MILNQDTIIVLMFQKLIDNYVAYQKTYYVKMIIQNTTSNSINVFCTGYYIVTSIMNLITDLMAQNMNSKATFNGCKGSLS